MAIARDGVGKGKLEAVDDYASTDPRECFVRKHLAAAMSDRGRPLRARTDKQGVYG